MVTSMTPIRISKSKLPMILYDLLEYIPENDHKENFFLNFN